MIKMQTLLIILLCVGLWVIGLKMGWEWRRRCVRRAVEKYVFGKYHGESKQEQKQGNRRD